MLAVGELSCTRGHNPFSKPWRSFGEIQEVINHRRKANRDVKSHYIVITSSISPTLTRKEMITEPFIELLRKPLEISEVRTIPHNELGPDYVLDQFASVTPVLHSEYQQVHCNLFSRRVGRNCNRLVGQRSIGHTPKRNATTWLSHSKTSAFGSLLDFMSLTKRDLRIASHNTPGTMYVDEASQ